MENKKKRTKRVLVTVGSTKFDDLISTVTDFGFLTELRQQGFTHVRLQTGRGKAVTDVDRLSTESGVVCETFQFTQEFSQELQQASLVIGHAGPVRAPSRRAPPQAVGAAGVPSLLPARDPCLFQARGQFWRHSGCASRWWS